MSLEMDIATVQEHERALRFKSFSAETAWAIGSYLRASALAREAAMTFEIQLAHRLLFQCATLDAPAGHMDWIRRKRNSVLRFSRSTYALGLELQEAGLTMEAKHGLSVTEYVMHGGGFPIYLEGSGCVGTIVASGLPQREDHAMVVDALAATLGVDVPRLV